MRALDKTSAHDRVLAMMPLIENANPQVYDLSPEGFARSAADAVRWLAAILLNCDRPSPAPLHLSIASACGASEAVADAIRRTLILAADHEFDVTTHAVRSAATGVTPYAAIQVGLIAGQGQKLRIRRAESVRLVLKEIVSSARPEEVVVALFRTGEPIPGFERLELHETGDPRAAALFDSLASVFADDTAFERLSRAMAVATTLTGSRPSFILGVMFLGLKLGLDGDELAVGTIGRAIGWIAHAQEQQAAPGLERPRATYIGPLPQPHQS